MPVPAAPPKPLPHSLTKAAFAGWRLLGSLDPFPSDALSLRLEWAADTLSGTFTWASLATIAAPPSGTTLASYAVPWTWNQQPAGGVAGGVIRFRFVAVNADGETPGPHLLWAYARPFFDPTDPAGQRGAVMRFLDVAAPTAANAGADAASILFALQNPAEITDAMVRSSGQLTEVLALSASNAPRLHLLPVAGVTPREIRLRRVSVIERDGATGYGSLFCFSDALTVTPPAAHPVLVAGTLATLKATHVLAAEGGTGWELSDGQGYTAHVREGTSAPDGWTVALSRDGATGLASFAITPPGDRLAFTGLVLRRLDTGEAVRFDVAEGAVVNTGGWGPIRRFLVTPGGEPDTDPPAAPGELEMVMQGHTFLDLRHKAMPARGRSLRVQQFTGSGWVTLPPIAVAGGSLVSLVELTPSTLHLLRSLAVNSIGETPGPEQHVYTLGSAPFAPPSKPGPPVLAARTPASATIGQSAWQASQSEMRLYRNGRLLHIFTATGQTFLDVTAKHGDEYTLAASSRAGISEQSDPLTLNLHSEFAIEILAPIEGAVLAGNFEVVFIAECVLTSPSISIGGLSKGAVASGAGTTARYVASGHTSLFVSGARRITARGLDPDGFPLEGWVDVSLVNDAASGTKYLSVHDTRRTTGTHLGRVGLGVRTGPLSPSVFRQFWMQARLLSTGQTGVSATWDADDLTAEQLATHWNTAQPVAFTSGGASPIVGGNGGEAGGVGGSVWHYKAHVAVDRPGVRVYMLLRQTPVQTLFWLDTERDTVVSIKRFSWDTNEGLGILARNIAPSAPGAALWRFTVEPVGEGDNAGLYSVPVWTLSRDLDGLAPDAFDWAQHDGKLYVLRDGATSVRVIDLNEGEEVLDVAMPVLALPVRFIEKLVGKVLVICGTATRTACFDLTFPAPKLLWDVAWGASAVAVFGGDSLMIARGTRVYHSPAGTAAPVLLDGAAASDIVTISRDTVVIATADGGSTQATWVRCVDGTYHRVSTVAGVTTLADLTVADGGASGVGTWVGSLDVVHGLAVKNPTTVGQTTTPARIIEQGANGAWYDGAELVPPGGQAAPSIATAVHGFALQLRAASGTFGSPGYRPPLMDWKMLIGTGTSGLVAVLEKARISEADGAIKAGPIEHAYLRGLEAPLPVTPPATGGSGGSGGSGGGSGGA